MTKRVKERPGVSLGIKESVAWTPTLCGNRNSIGVRVVVIPDVVSRLLGVTGLETIVVSPKPAKT